MGGLNRGVLLVGEFLEFDDFVSVVDSEGNSWLADGRNGWDETRDQ